MEKSTKCKKTNKPGHSKVVTAAASDPVDWGPTKYPASILIIGTHPAQGLELKQKLEDQGCQVCWIDVHPDSLNAACQKYFDLVVLDVAQLEIGGVEMCQKIRVIPGLADVPLVALITHDQAENVMRGSETSVTYCFAKDALVETKLLYIIDQVHYLINRYL